jgi:hypothetical protein
MQLIRCGRRTSRILGSTRLDPRSMLAFIIATVSASSHKLPLCYTAAAPSPSLVWARGMCHSDTGSRQNKNFADHCGNTSASETSRAKAELHQQPTVQSSCISTIGHASAEKPHPEHSQIALPRASNAPWSRWRSSSVSTFMQSHEVPRTEMQ